MNLMSGMGWVRHGKGIKFAAIWFRSDGVSVEQCGVSFYGSCCVGPICEYDVAELG